MSSLFSRYLPLVLACIPGAPRSLLLVENRSSDLSEFGLADADGSGL